MNGIFRYRFTGEHSGSQTGNAISFSDDVDCDGFSEVLIGAPTFATERGAGWSGAPGAAYVVSMADVAAADGADGVTDGLIELGVIADQPRSWKLVGGTPSTYLGVAVTAGGDVDGDGCSELLVGTAEGAYVISAFDLAGGDAADGMVDGVVNVERIADQPSSWKIDTGARVGVDGSSQGVIFAGDVNGDGRSDLLIGAPWDGDLNGAAYLLSGAALAAADAEDGVVDGRVAASSVAAQPDSWKLFSKVARNGVSSGGLSTANLDSDDRPDLLVTAPATWIDDPAMDSRGAVYLIAASDLPALDGADGRADGLIDLDNVADGSASWKLVGDFEQQQIGYYGVAAGDVDGDGVDNVIVNNISATATTVCPTCPTGDDGRDAEVFVLSVSNLPAADAADGVRDGVATLERAVERDGSFKLTRKGAWIFYSVFSGVDIDGDGLEDILVGDDTYVDGDWCLPGGGARGNGAVHIVSGAFLDIADASDGTADSVIDLDHLSVAERYWRVVGGPTDRLGVAVRAGDVDGDGRDDPIVGSGWNHTPYLDCGSRLDSGYAFLISSAHLATADAVDGETDGEIHLAALRGEVEDPEPPEPSVAVVRELTQFEDSVVVMHVSGSLETSELDFDALARSFYSHYRDEFDYLIFLSNATGVVNQRYRYAGIHMSTSNTVTGTGRQVHDSGGTLKAMLHLTSRHAILYGPSLHEIMHSWANYAIPTVEPFHWGFSSANGQLGGFDLDDLVRLGNGRYSAGRFGTFANGGNSLPYSPIELYLAGLIPPHEVPDLWVAKDGRWLDQEDQAGNSVFEASEVETWSIGRIVEEHGMRVPDWRSSQKSFRGAVVLITDDTFPATSTILRELGEALETFSYAGPDGNDDLFNFWEATGGRATFKVDDLQGSGVPQIGNRSPVVVEALAALRIRTPVTVEVSGVFRDPDGDELTYRAASSAPGVVSVAVSGSAVTVTPEALGTATVTVTATDAGGSSATQAFAVTVLAFFTDDPLVRGVTSVKAVHFTELRARIDALLVMAGLPRFSWTDGVLTAGITPIRLVHLMELREALGAAYAAVGRTAPGWTEAAATGRTIPIRAVHLMELRAAVTALE